MTQVNDRVRSTVFGCHEGEVIQINDGPGYSEPVYTILWDNDTLSYVNADAFEVIEDEDTEPFQSHDLSDDADALASMGWGTDEDYGSYGDEY